MTFHQHQLPCSLRVDSQIVAIGSDIVGILQSSGQGFQLRVLDARFDMLDGSRFASRAQAVAAAENLNRTLQAELDRS